MEGIIAELSRTGIEFFKFNEEESGHLAKQLDELKDQLIFEVYIGLHSAGLDLIKGQRNSLKVRVLTSFL